MKKLISIVFFLFLFSVYTTAQKQKSDWETGGFKGKVKTVKMYDYYGGVKETSYSISFFDADGYLTNVNFFETYGGVEKLDKRNIYQYDSVRNLVGIDTYMDDSLENQLIYTYKYDRQNHLIEKRNYNPGSVQRSKDIYINDSKGYMIEHDYYYDAEGNITAKEIYDDKGNKIEENSYEHDGSLNTKDTYKYNNKGQVIEHNSHSPVGHLDYKETLKYNDKGDLIESARLSKGKTEKSTFKYIYDSHSNWTKIIYNYYEMNSTMVDMTDRIITYY